MQTLTHTQLFKAILIAATLSAVPAIRAAEYNVLIDIPYAEDNRIRDNIKDECTALGTKLSTFVVEYAAKKGIAVKQVQSLDPGAPGRNLVIEITDAMSRGNAFIGHQKFMDARGELFIDGVSKSTQEYSRHSMGGVGAGFKGSCSVLGRNSKALGKDFSVWLKQVDKQFL